MDEELTIKFGVFLVNKDRDLFNACEGKFEADYNSTNDNRELITDRLTKEQDDSVKEYWEQFKLQARHPRR